MMDQLRTSASNLKFLRELARKYDTSCELVEFVFSREWQRLAEGARITRYLDILAMKRTRHALKVEAARLSVLSLGVPQGSPPMILDTKLPRSLALEPDAQPV
jgi:Protein of unknown function (DUF3562)